eukprot:7192807-Prymnesium_polylepis.1
MLNEPFTHKTARVRHGVCMCGAAHPRIYSGGCIVRGRRARHAVARFLLVAPALDDLWRIAAVVAAGCGALGSPSHDLAPRILRNRTLCACATSLND